MCGLLSLSLHRPTGRICEAYGKIIRDHLVQRLQDDPQDLEDTLVGNPVSAYIETNLGNLVTMVR